MIKPSYTDRLLRMIPDSARVIRPRSENNSMFAELYDVCMGNLFRYIYFLVPNNSVAEGLAFKSFITAWGQFENHPRVWGVSFLERLYSIAHDKIMEFFETHRIISSSYNEFASAAGNGDFWTELQSIRKALKGVPELEKHALVLGFIINMPDVNIARILKIGRGEVKKMQARGLLALTDNLHDISPGVDEPEVQGILEKWLKQISNGAWTWDECLLRFPNHAARLGYVYETFLIIGRGHELKPSQTFFSVNHNALGVYIQTQSQMKQTINILPMLRRGAMTLTVLVLALLITGTAHAQTVLPGDAFYGWKRASERAWLAMSSDPVATNLTLSERRLDEWLAVADNPEFGPAAMNEYREVVTYLESLDDENPGQIISALQSQQQELRENGLTSAELNAYLNLIFETIPATPPAQAGPSDNRPTEPPGQVDVPSGPNLEDACAPNCENGNAIGSGSVNNGPDRGNKGGNDKPNKGENNNGDKGGNGKK